MTKEKTQSIINANELRGRKIEMVIIDEFSNIKQEPTAEETHSQKRNKQCIRNMRQR